MARARSAVTSHFDTVGPGCKLRDMLSALFVLLAPVEPADLVVKNADLWSDGIRTPGAFIAVRRGHFAYVGKPDESFVGPSTVVVDAKGRVVLPGFIDSHAHLMGGGPTLNQLDLRDCQSKADLLKRVQDYAATLPADQWVVGNNWSAESWPEKSEPTRNELDAVTGGRPTVLHRMDGHSLVANSAAIARAKVTKDTKSPAGGSIDKDAVTGEPTGGFRETAMAWIELVVPAPTRDQRSAGLRAATKLVNGYGVTAVSEIGSIGDWPLYEEYGKSAPTVRLALYSTAGDWASLAKRISETRLVPGWVEPKGIKAYMDGSLGSRTAWMLEPFTKPLPGQKELSGLPRPGVTDGSYASGIAAAAKAGIQVIVHAIGDRANREVLGLFAANAPNLGALRFRVEHAQHTSPADIPRFAQLGVIPSMQPYHKADDGRYCDDVIGPERSRHSYAYRELLDSKAALAFGSDWPVVSANPWLGVEAAVDALTMDGKIWNPQQSVTVSEALKGYTSTAAFAMKMDHQIGKVKAGFRADFQILKGSPFASKPDWKSLRPEELYVGGERVALP